jgi:Acetyltransferase (GNAT) family
MQRRGLGKLLLARLAAAARERGITRFRAEVLRTNQPMIALVHELDATAEPALDGPVATYDLAIPQLDEPETRYATLFRSLRRATGSASRAATLESGGGAMPSSVPATTRTPRLKACPRYSASASSRRPGRARSSELPSRD